MEILPSNTTDILHAWGAHNNELVVKLCYDYIQYDPSNPMPYILLEILVDEHPNLFPVAGRALLKIKWTKQRCRCHEHDIYSETAKVQQFLANDPKNSYYMLLLGRLHECLHDMTIESIITTYYEPSAFLGNSNAQYALAWHISNMEVPDIPKMLITLSASSWGGCAEAQISLGDYYFDGELIQPNYYKAKHFYNLASAQGSAIASFYLGDILLHETNDNEGWRYIAAAAEQDFFPALHRMGLAYSSGDCGFPKDEKKSVKFHIKAAKYGSLYSLFELGEKYSKGEEGVIERNPKRALHYYQRAGEKGLKCACRRVSKLYRGVPGICRDSREAHRWSCLAKR